MVNSRQSVTRKSVTRQSVTRQSVTNNPRVSLHDREIRSYLHELDKFDKVKIIQQFNPDDQQCINDWSVDCLFTIVDPITNCLIGTYKEFSNVGERKRFKSKRKFTAMVVRGCGDIKKDRQARKNSVSEEPRSSVDGPNPRSSLDGSNRRSSVGGSNTRNSVGAVGRQSRLNKIKIEDARASVASAKLITKTSTDVLFKLVKPRKQGFFLNPACTCCLPMQALLGQEGAECAHKMTVFNAKNIKISSVKQTLPMTPSSWLNCFLSIIFPPFMLLAGCCTNFNLTIYDDRDEPRYTLSSNYAKSLIIGGKNKKILIYAEKDVKTSTDELDKDVVSDISSKSSSESSSESDSDKEATSNQQKPENESQSSNKQAGDDVDEEFDDEEKKAKAKPAKDKNKLGKRQVVGHFTKRWKGALKGYISTEEELMVQFPRDACPKMKAGIISAVMLWEVALWERRQDFTHSTKKA